MIEYRGRRLSLILLIPRLPGQRLQPTRPITPRVQPSHHLFSFCFLFLRLLLNIILHINHLINQQTHFLGITKHSPPTSIFHRCASRIRQSHDYPFARTWTVWSATYSLKSVADAPIKGGLCGEFECILALDTNFEKDDLVFFGQGVAAATADGCC